MRILAGCLVLFLACCGGQGPAGQFGDPAGDAAAAESDANASYESIWKEQKLIRNAEIDIEVGDLGAGVQAVEEIASRHGGIIADSQQTRRSDESLYASIRVRVPASAFEPTVADLRKVGRVSSEGVTAEDVTKAYYDLETRLAVKQETAKRLRELLANRTGTLADVIAAEAELSRVTSEIELMQGEKRFYDHRIATSTIQVSLTEPGGFWSSLVLPIRYGSGSLAAVLGQSASALVFLLAVLLPWAAVGSCVWLIWRAVARRRQRPPAA
ncbi:MAG: DUF4349 domain-containing protein [Bryobacterales bacterium]|nr:DUF4349 domain-containing protein [Acidobacteriota bacterium]MCB9383104.1 DUF4349 domain-containing protein [Bryobacterales bacterium]